MYLSSMDIIFLLAEIPVQKAEDKIYIREPST
jgi:hypothetical protein